MTSSGMKTLKEYILKAREEKKAIGHFNISNIEGLWAIFNAARALNVPVIIGVSEGERSFVGVRQAAALVKSLRDEFYFPIFINADHTYTFEKVKDAVDAGFDMVIFDGAGLSLEDNIKETLRCVEYARKVNPTILVEGELGFIGKSSQIIDAIPEGVSKETETTDEDAKRFFELTGVDLLAPSVGNFHGMLKSGGEKIIDIERIASIKEAVPIPLVLHGGSGDSDETFTKAINAGICIIHVNTELRVAYQKAIKKSLEENPDETTPYKIMRPVVSQMQKLIDAKLRLFNKM